MPNAALRNSSTMSRSPHGRAVRPARNESCSRARSCILRPRRRRNGCREKVSRLPRRRRVPPGRRSGRSGIGTAPQTASCHARRPPPSRRATGSSNTACFRSRSVATGAPDDPARSRGAEVRWTAGTAIRMGRISRLRSLGKWVFGRCTKPSIEQTGRRVVGSSPGRSSPTWRRRRGRVVRRGSHRSREAMNRVHTALTSDSVRTRRQTDAIRACDRRSRLRHFEFAGRCMPPPPR